MKNESPLFDRIRVKPDKDRRARAQCPGCEWPNCRAPGTHRAPKGRLREREYWQFCLDHVREYNHTYNFFSGMSADDIAQLSEGSRYRASSDLENGHERRKAEPGAHTPRDFIRNSTMPMIRSACSANSAVRPAREQCAEPQARTVRNAGRKALDALGLEGDASPQDVKTRFKALVKRHHPDANGGDRSSEDKLREIIQAYNYLKSIGFR